MKSGLKGGLEKVASVVGKFDSDLKVGGLDDTAVGFGKAGISIRCHADNHLRS